jgi:hypothetical protein
MEDSVLVLSLYRYTSSEGNTDTPYPYAHGGNNGESQIVENFREFHRPSSKIKCAVLKLDPQSKVSWLLCSWNH